jgi:hypothetical protein
MDDVSFNVSEVLHEAPSFRAIQHRLDSVNRREQEQQRSVAPLSNAPSVAASRAVSVADGNSAAIQPKSILVSKPVNPSNTSNSKIDKEAIQMSARKSWARYQEATGRLTQLNGSGEDSGSQMNYGGEGGDLSLSSPIPVYQRARSVKVLSPNSAADAVNREERPEMATDMGRLSAIPPSSGPGSAREAAAVDQHLTPSKYRLPPADDSLPMSAIPVASIVMSQYPQSTSFLTTQTDAGNPQPRTAEMSPPPKPMDRLLNRKTPKKTQTPLRGLSEEVASIARRVQREEDSPAANPLPADKRSLRSPFKRRDGSTGTTASWILEDAQSFALYIKEAEEKNNAARPKPPKKSRSAAAAAGESTVKGPKPHVTVSVGCSPFPLNFNPVLQQGVSPAGKSDIADISDPEEAYRRHREQVGRRDSKLPHKNKARPTDADRNEVQKTKDGDTQSRPQKSDKRGKPIARRTPSPPTSEADDSEEEDQDEEEEVHQPKNHRGPQSRVPLKGSSKAPLASKDKGKKEKEKEKEAKRNAPTPAKAKGKGPTAGGKSKSRRSPSSSSSPSREESPVHHQAAASKPITSKPVSSAAPTARAAKPTQAQLKAAADAKAREEEKQRLEAEAKAKEEERKRIENAALKFANAYKRQHAVTKSMSMSMLRPEDEQPKRRPATDGNAGGSRKRPRSESAAFAHGDSDADVGGYDDVEQDLMALDEVRQHLGTHIHSLQSHAKPNTAPAQRSVPAASAAPQARRGFTPSVMAPPVPTARTGRNPVAMNQRGYARAPVDDSDPMAVFFNAAFPTAIAGNVLEELEAPRPRRGGHALTLRPIRQR